MKTFIDPPDGALYGFPKELPPDVKDRAQWLINNGYPKDDVMWALNYCRQWTIHEDGEETTD